MAKNWQRSEERAWVHGTGSLSTCTRPLIVQDRLGGGKQMGPDWGLGFSYAKDKTPRDSKYFQLNLVFYWAGQNVPLGFFFFFITTTQRWYGKTQVNFLANPIDPPLKAYLGDFHGGSVVKNPPPCHDGDTNLIPGLETKISHAVGQPSPHATMKDPTWGKKISCATTKTQVSQVFFF